MSRIRLAVLICALVWEGASTAAPTCLTLLTALPEVSRNYDSSQLSAAGNWTNGLQQGWAPKGFPEDPDRSESAREDDLARFTLGHWERWAATTRAQRSANLSLELSRLAPPQARTVVGESGYAELASLSARNLERLTARLAQIYPLPANSNLDEAGQTALIQASNLELQYIRRLENGRRLETGINTPMVSPRELGRLNISEPYGDFYSDLIEQSPSVAFHVAASNQERPLYNIGAYVANDAARLNPGFATENAFMVPQLRNALDLIALFNQWNPSAVDDLMATLRFSLPPEVRTRRDLTLYLTPNRLDQIFPTVALSKVLAPLRQRLNEFVLSETDAQIFLRAAFERFLTVRSLESRRLYRDLMSKLTREGGVQAVFATDFMQFLGFSGLSMRVPVVVNPAQYYVLRREASPARRQTNVDSFLPVTQNRWDSRRLDLIARP